MEPSKSSAGTLFPPTHWSLVLAAGQSSSASSNEALEELCRAYWFPLYSFVRQQGHGPEEAQDLTQGFFAHLLEKNVFARADAQRGRFRCLLLRSLQNFLHEEWQRARAKKRGGGRLLLSWEEQSAEERYQKEVDPELPPDKLFDQRWALALFQKALNHLQQEFTEAGKSAQFEELKRFLSSEAGAAGYANVASRLGLSPGAVAVAVHRLRQRYGELVREEIARTVDSVSEIEQEMRYLIALVTT